MTTLVNKPTCNIRIPKQTHEQIKNICKREGRLIGAFVNIILNKAISEEKAREVSSRESAPQTKPIRK